MVRVHTSTCKLSEKGTEFFGLVFVLFVMSLLLPQELAILKINTKTDVSGKVDTYQISLLLWAPE